MFRSVFQIPVRDGPNHLLGSPPPVGGNLESPVIPTAGSTIDNIEINDLVFLQLLVQNLNISQRNLPEKFGVQDRAPRGSRHPNQGEPFILGAGATCTVVQHETDDETSDIVPPRTLVALKIYKRQIPAHRASDQDLAHVIWQDLRTLCHPQFRNHENFCQILFIGWHDYSIVPSIVLELAAYGTLQDALRSEPTLSYLQKCHVCLDVAVGLFTMHSCGFIHGDMKPENVMLQRHPSREVVAKLLDFAGATDETRFGSGRHRRFMSKLWYPVEALSDRMDIDWRKVDCYSYGMLITHIFSQVDFQNMDCYLQSYLPDDCTDVEKDNILLKFKTCPEVETISVLNQSIKLAREYCEIPRSLQVTIPLELIQRRTLSVNPHNRADFSEILPEFRIFANAHGRDLVLNIDTTTAVEQDQQALKSLSESAFFAFSKEFAKRTEEHKTTFFRYMIEISGPASMTMDYLNVGQDSDYSDPAALFRLLSLNMGLFPPPAEYYLRKLHYQIAMCYFMGYGCKINERDGLRFLASAALGKVRRAMNMYTQMEASCTFGEIDWDMPRRLLLCLGFAGGCTISADILAKQYPITHRALKVVRQVYTEPLWKVICNKNDDISLQSDYNVADEDRIFQIIESEDVSALQQFLDANPNTNLTHSSGITTLHALSLISDETAAEMACILLRHGADLAQQASERQRPSTSRLNFGWGTPVIWAIVKSRPKLFAAYMDSCIEAHKDLPAGDASIFAVTVTSREPEMLRNLLGCKHAFAEEGRDMASREYRSMTAWLAVEDNSLQTIMHRWALGARFQRSRRGIAELLIDMGIDPLDKPRTVWTNPLCYAILKGDSICLEVYTNALKSQGYALLDLLGPDGLLKMGQTKEIRWSALMGSICAPSLEAMYYLTAHFPGLINQPSSLGRTALMQSISDRSTEAALHLMQRGADIHYRTAKGVNAFVTALTHGAIDIATEIVKRGNKDDLLGTGDESQPSAFYMILETFLNGRKQIPLESFAFLHRIGGLPFLVHQSSEEEPLQMTAWRAFFSHTRPSMEGHVLADLRLLRFLLRTDVFRGKLDDIDWTGFTALHHAIRHGYAEAVELLLEAGASINMESLPAKASFAPTPNVGGQAPADWALSIYDRGPPENILSGGAIGIRAWRDRMASILDLLHRNGAKCGSAAPYELQIQWQLVEETDLLVKSAIQSANHYREEYERGRWPECIPQGLDNKLDTMTS